MSKHKNLRDLPEKKITFKKMTSDEILLFVYLYENNVSMNDLAEYFGKNLSSIHRQTQGLNLRRKSIDDLIEEFNLGKKPHKSYKEYSDKEIQESLEGQANGTNFLFEVLFRLWRVTNET